MHGGILPETAVEELAETLMGTTSPGASLDTDQT